VKEGQAEPVFMNKNEIPVFKNPSISAEVIFRYLVDSNKLFITS
jgi:hypothetical protein